MLKADRFTASKAVLLMSFAVAVLLLLVVSIPTLAQDVVSDDEVNAIAKEVYCPVCENTPLDVCETKACADWRELIRDKLGQGETREEIFAYFSNQYGDRVLASPPREGFNLILWIGPFIALVFGTVLFGRYLSNLKSVAEQTNQASVTTDSATDAPEPSDDDYVARIEQELTNK